MGVTVGTLDLDAYVGAAGAAIDAAPSTDALDAVAAEYLGKKSQLALVQRTFGSLSDEEKRTAGAASNRCARPSMDRSAPAGRCSKQQSDSNSSRPIASI